ncbi:glycosyltransferase [Pelagibacterales bacterium SAG-MED38]|nr:glycosyltransferase [Pelagibacterales bacterium SAG-MED38]
MRICYISNSAAPSKNASSLQIAKLCEFISKIGNNVELILPHTGEIKKNYFKYYNIKNRFKIKRLKFFKKFPIGINFYLYSIFAILSSDYNNKDLFITRNFFTSFLLSIFKKKHILEIHDDIEIEGRLVKILVKYLNILNFKYLVKIATTTKSLKKKYISYGTIAKKIEVLHNASSLSTVFKKIKRKNSYKIGYFGSIFKSRGIEMITKLSKIDKKNRYFIFGGSLKDVRQLQNKIRNKNISFSPYIPYSKISNEINKIDICILPYTSKITVSGNVGDISKYTSPLKVFDYMKLGKLIISSNIPVLREVLFHNQNCLLVNKFSEEKEWHKVIKFVTNNFEKYEKIRRNAYKYANKFDLNWRVKKLLAFKKFSN